MSRDAIKGKEASFKIEDVFAQLSKNKKEHKTLAKDSKISRKDAKYIYIFLRSR